MERKTVPREVLVNKESMGGGGGEPDPDKRRTELKRLQAIAEDRARMKDFLMESALIARWRRSEAVP